MNDNYKTKDSKKYRKDCDDFTCLPDGTNTGEYKYCKFSMTCHQLDYDETGKLVNMESHFLPILSASTGEVTEHQLFCTGIIDRRPKSEKIEDDKVS